jgi:hypothetical protein
MIYLLFGIFVGVISALAYEIMYFSKNIKDEE